MPEPDSTSGNAAKNTLLTLIGDRQIQFDALIELLVRKGLFTEGEWDAMLTEGYRAHDFRPVAEWARRSLDPPDLEALDTYFGQ
jgi:hypothetical protein